MQERVLEFIYYLLCATAYLLVGEGMFHNRTKEKKRYFFITAIYVVNLSDFKYTAFCFLVSGKNKDKVSTVLGGISVYQCYRKFYRGNRYPFATKRQKFLVIYRLLYCICAFNNHCCTMFAQSGMDAKVYCLF